MRVSEPRVLMVDPTILGKFLQYPLGWLRLVTFRWVFHKDLAVNSGTMSKRSGGILDLDRPRLVPDGVL